MLERIKGELAEVIKQRSLVLVELTYKGVSPAVIFDEVDEIRKLKESLDKLDEVS